MAVFLLLMFPLFAGTALEQLPQVKLHHRPHVEIYVPKHHKSPVAPAPESDADNANLLSWGEPK